MENNVEGKYIKKEESELMSTDERKISMEVQVNTVKKESDYLIQSELNIKIEQQEDENDFPAIVDSFNEICPYDPMKFETDEPTIKIECQNLSSEIMQDPLDISSKIKVEMSNDDASHSDMIFYQSKQTSQKYDASEIDVTEEKKNEPNKCLLCSKIYRDRAGLRKHKYMVHEVQASFICDFCGKGFKTSYRCRYHMKLHLTNEKGPDLCKCEFCGKIFSNIVSFESHAQSQHDGNIAVLCVLCEDQFPDTKIFKNHIQTHLAMYKCQNCEMEFEKFNDLKLHYRTHTGEKLFVCPICNKNYCHRNSLNRHVLKTHDIHVSVLVPVKI